MYFRKSSGELFSLTQLNKAKKPKETQHGPVLTGFNAAGWEHGWEKPRAVEDLARLPSTEPERLSHIPSFQLTIQRAE